MFIDKIGAFRPEKQDRGFAWMEIEVQTIQKSTKKRLKTGALNISL
jgi:hypothetical protein